MFFFYFAKSLKLLQNYNLVIFIYIFFIDLKIKILYAYLSIKLRLWIVYNILVNVESLAKRIYNSGDYRMIIGHYDVVFPFKFTNSSKLKSGGQSRVHILRQLRKRNWLAVNPPGFSIGFAFFHDAELNSSVIGYKSRLAFPTRDSVMPLYALHH